MTNKTGNMSILISNIRFCNYFIRNLGYIPAPIYAQAK